MNSGLEQKTVNDLNAIFSKYPQVDKVLIFGSRAMGNYQANSDIDLAFAGDGLTQSILGDILLDIEDLYIPYKIDAQLLSAIKHAKLIDHIERVGVVFYERR